MKFLLNEKAFYRLLSIPRSSLYLTSDDSVLEGLLLTCLSVALNLSHTKYEIWRVNLQETKDKLEGENVSVCNTTSPLMPWHEYVKSCQDRQLLWSRSKCPCCPLMTNPEFVCLYRSSRVTCYSVTEVTYFERTQQRMCLSRLHVRNKQFHFPKLCDY
jgi:hypothetical protein